MVAHWSRIWSRNRSVGTPSTPAAPPFRSTRFRAASMFSLLTTCSIRLLRWTSRGVQPGCAVESLRPPAVPCGFTTTFGEQAPCGVFCVVCDPLERTGFTPLSTFGPSQARRPSPGTMAAADFCRVSRTLQFGLPASLASRQTSPDKNAHFHPAPTTFTMQPFDSRRFCCVWPAHLGGIASVCGSCPLGRGFASGFLRIPPRGGHPCLWLLDRTV